MKCKNCGSKLMMYAKYNYVEKIRHLYKCEECGRMESHWVTVKEE